MEGGGEGLTIATASIPRPFGTALVMATPSTGSPASPSPTPARSRRRSPTCARAGRRRRYVEDAARDRADRARASSIRRVAPGPAAARRADRHRFRSEGLGDAARRSRWARRTTYSDIAAQLGKPKAARAVGAAVGKNPISLRGAVPSRARQDRRAHRLSLGHDAQARDARLGSRAWRRVHRWLTPPRSSTSDLPPSTSALSR